MPFTPFQSKKSSSRKVLRSKSVEGSPMDKAMDKKMGYKEGSPADMKQDKALAKRSKRPFSKSFPKR